MKKILAFVLSLSLSTTAFAKKVKFAVDMDTITPMVTGIHIGGDFQVAAGYAFDWDSGITPMTQEGSSSIYSVVVDIPAFAKYEFKFINGDQWYEAEFVPVESRVGYNFNDNRWIYVDSLANDTTFVGAILFSGNAPKNLTLMRFLVDMSNESSVDPTGVHVAGTFQGSDPATTRLYSFGANVYEIIAYGSTSTYQYNFYNGNTVGTIETLTGACSTGGARELVLAKDSVLATVCFSFCSACILNGVALNTNEVELNLFPNPANGVTELTINDGQGSAYDVSIADLTGKTLRSYPNASGHLKIDSQGLSTGMYFVTALNKGSAKSYTLKLVVQ